MTLIISMCSIKHWERSQWEVTSVGNLLSVFPWHMVQNCFQVFVCLFIFPTAKTFNSMICATHFSFMSSWSWKTGCCIIIRTNIHILYAWIYYSCRTCRHIAVLMLYISKCKLWINQHLQYADFCHVNKNYLYGILEDFYLIRAV